MFISSAKGQNSSDMFALTSALSLSAADLARPATPSAQRLSTSPNIWMTHDFLSPATVAHMISKVPKDEAAYSPCIGQVDEFASKRCTHLPVAGDALMEAAIAKIEHEWDIDVERLKTGGLPLIRYLPGAPPVGKHGDEDRHGVVPNATLVVYLTKPSGPSAGGRTIFPEADVEVTPKQGSVLSFQNVDDHGARHPLAKHYVSAVPKDSEGDRLILQVPICHKGNGVRAHAFPEHVSGNKKPGEHESMHGNSAQKAAAAAATAAGFGIAIAYMAAVAGKFAPDDYDELKKAAEASGKFTEEEMKKP
jgi:hypothetical protein